MATFHRDGIQAAFDKFMAQAGFDQGEPGPEAHDPAHQDADEWQPSEQEIADSVRMFGYDILGTTRYRPDVAALTARPGSGGGGCRRRLRPPAHPPDYRRPGRSARRAMAEFPGDHGGFLPEPFGFAQVLKQVLADQPAGSDPPSPSLVIVAGVRAQPPPFAGHLAGSVVPPADGTLAMVRSASLAHAAALRGTPRRLGPPAADGTLAMVRSASLAQPS